MNINEYPPVTMDMVEAMKGGLHSDPQERKVKVIHAAYHPGHVLRTIEKYLSNGDLSDLRESKDILYLTPAELELLLEYRRHFNPAKIDDLADWARYVMASELLARAFHVEQA